MVCIFWKTFVLNSHDVLCTLLMIICKFIWSISKVEVTALLIICLGYLIFLYCDVKRIVDQIFCTKLIGCNFHTFRSWVAILLTFSIHQIITLDIWVVDWQILCCHKKCLSTGIKAIFSLIRRWYSDSKFRCGGKIVFIISRVFNIKLVSAGPNWCSYIFLFS